MAKPPRWKIYLKSASARQVTGVITLLFTGTDEDAEDICRALAHSFSRTDNGLPVVIAESNDNFTFTVTIRGGKTMLVVREQDGVQHRLVHNLRKRPSRGSTKLNKKPND